MQFLRQIFFLKQLYFAHTLVDLLFDLLYMVVAYLLLYELSSAAPAWRWLGILAAAGLLYFYLRACLRTFMVKRRLDGTPEIAESGAPVTTHLSAATDELSNNVDRIRLLAQGSDWCLYDAVFYVYTQTKDGEYLSKRVYYTVFEGQLRREVPHIIFDSKTAKGRQFRYLYLRSQRLSLEGGFDTYFDTYSPETYQIDTLSFITPEVMEVLIGLRDCDIELVDGRVVCLAPLLDEPQLGGLQTRAQNLQRHLNDNLATYRDDRLPGSQRMNQVTPFARALLRSPVRYVPAAAASFAGLLVTAYVGIRFSPGLMNNQLSWFALLIFISSIYRIGKIVSENHRLQAVHDRSYKQA